MRTTVKPDAKRSQKLIICVTPKEHSTLKILAERSGLSMADFVRKRTIYDENNMSLIADLKIEDLIKAPTESERVE